MTERIIRYVRVDEGDVSVPIYAGDPPEPLQPHWIAIAMTEFGQPLQRAYHLYLLTDPGEVLECLEFETLEITLNQAKLIAGVSRSKWASCYVLVPETGVVPWSLVA